MKKIINFQNLVIDTKSVKGGIGGPATSDPIGSGTATGVVPPSGKSEDVVVGDWYDEGCAGSEYG
tara:strand:+ start:192 stop:386 length:195 start_codon:yes stop_codon:yes gene_type:complete